MKLVGLFGLGLVVGATSSLSKRSQLDAVIAMFYYIPFLRSRICSLEAFPQMAFISDTFKKHPNTEKPLPSTATLFSEEQRLLLQDHEPANTASIIWNIIRETGMKELFFMRGHGELSSSIDDYFTEANLQDDLSKRNRNPRGPFILVSVSKNIERNELLAFELLDFFPLAIISTGLSDMYHLSFLTDSQGWMVISEGESFELKRNQLRLLLNSAEILLLGQSHTIKPPSKPIIRRNFIEDDTFINAILMSLPFMIILYMLMLCSLVSDGSTGEFSTYHEYSTMGF